MKMFKIFFLLFLALCLQACPKYSREPDMQFTLENKSNENIYIYANTEATVKRIQDIYSGKEYLEKIDTGKIYIVKYWESLFKNKKLNILIFKESTINNHTWQEIQKKNISDKLYILTLEELKAMNYKIIYN